MRPGASKKFAVRGAVMQGTLRDENGKIVCDRCTLARDTYSRMVGLLGRTGLSQGEGILLQPAGSIHTFFMRFPIDAVFLDRERRVVRIAESMKPWRTAAARRSRSVLELAAGEAKRIGLQPGNVLQLEVQG
jgi:uncharacterized membrane protein (UPF0127 family)